MRRRPDPQSEHPLFEQQVPPSPPTPPGHATSGAALRRVSVVQRRRAGGARAGTGMRHWMREGVGKQGGALVVRWWCPPEGSRACCCCCCCCQQSASRPTHPPLPSSSTAAAAPPLHTHTCTACVAPANPPCRPTACAASRPRSCPAILSGWRGWAAAGCCSCCRQRQRSCAGCTRRVGQVAVSVTAHSMRCPESTATSFCCRRCRFQQPDRRLPMAAPTHSRTPRHRLRWHGRQRQPTSRPLPTRKLLARCRPPPPTTCPPRMTAPLTTLLLGPRPLRCTGSRPRLMPM